MLAPDHGEQRVRRRGQYVTVIPEVVTDQRAKRARLPWIFTVHGTLGTRNEKVLDFRIATLFGVEGMSLRQGASDSCRPSPLDLCSRQVFTSCSSIQSAPTTGFLSDGNVGLEQ